MRIHIAGRSDTGRVRAKNDDHYCIGPFVEQNSITSLTVSSDSRFFEQQGLLVAVADGMGGYAGGALASRVVLEKLSACFYAERRIGDSAHTLADSIRECLDQTLRYLQDVLGRSPELAEAGTTLAGIALMPGGTMVVFHVGDSRVLRACGGYVSALTVDHTPIGPDIVSGRLTEQEAANLPAAGQLTRSLGLRGDTRADINTESTWAPGDMLLLATDGMHGIGRGLSRQDIQQRIRESATEEPLGSLVNQMVGKAVEVDGQDNATLVVIRMEEDGAETRGDEGE